MARRITKASGQSFSLGNGGIGDRLAGIGAISCSFWIKPYSFSTVGAGDNVIFVLMVDGTNHGMKVNFNATAGNLLRVGARSISTDGFQSQVTTTAFVAGTKYHVGAVFDFAGDRLVCYVNGVQEFDQAVTFGSTSYDNGAPTIPDQIAIDSGTQFQMDADIAELTFHQGEWTAADFAAAAKNSPGAKIKPHDLLAYIPFRESSGNVVDLIQRTVGTQVGTIVKADHPPLQYSTPKLVAFGTAAPPSTSISTVPSTIARAETGLIITGTTFGAVQGTGTVTLGGESLTVTSWADTSITVTCPSGIDLLYQAATHTITVTADDASSDTSAAVPFTPVAGNSYINLSSPDWSSVNFMLYGFEGTPNPVTGDQMEFNTVTSPSSIPQLPPATSEWVLGSMPTVTQTSDVYILRAATGVRSAVWVITYPVAQLVNLVLVDFSSSPQINLTGLKWAFFDEAQPQLLTTPTATGSIETTDGSGAIEIDVTGTSLITGQTGFLIISDTDGTSAQSPASKAFAAPVDIT